MTRIRASLAGFFLSMGVAHLTFGARFFEAIVPPWVPGNRRTINRATGVAEICGGALAMIPGAEKPARRYLIALLLAVFPANVHMAVRPQDIKGADRLPAWLLWARLPLQFVAIAWVSRALPSEVRAEGDPAVRDQ